MDIIKKFTERTGKNTEQIGKITAGRQAGRQAV
jgi:hypothetical protein